MKRRQEDKIFEKKTYETTFKDKGTTEAIIDTKVELRSNKRSRISKIFGQIS